MTRITIFILIAMISLSSWAGENDVLVIESYHSEFAWDASYTKGLRETIVQPYQLSFFQMDTKRLPPEQYAHRADLAWAEYERLKPSLVVLGDDNALKFLGRRFAKTQTPVVYLGVNKNPRSYIPAGTRNITGVLERPLLKRSVETVRKLVTPSPRKVMVMFDSGTTSQASVKEAFQGRTNLKIFGITAELKLIGDWEEWQNTVLSAREHGVDAIIVGLYHTIVDSKDRNVPADKVLQWTSENTPVPLFAFWDFAVGKGKTAGGLVMYGYEQGKAAGMIAMRILDGADPHKIFPKTPQKGRLLFSKSQFQHYRLTLPASLVAVTNWTE